MKPISPFGFPIGLSVAFWTLMGILRFITETVEYFFGKKFVKKPYHKKNIAAILPAHNEEKVILATINALRVHLKPKQIYVASDGSTDETASLARTTGVNVVEINPGLGKAKAMTHLLEHFNLYRKYKLIFIIDADTQMDSEFIPTALNIFKDPKIAVVFARPEIPWPQHIIPRLKYYLIGYRERLNKLLWLMLIYGQTWKYTNAMYVIPGFCTIYRSDVLSKLEIDTPGLLIEDFNLAFQLYKQKLGKVGHARRVWGWDQHPDNILDYWKQVRRWNIGFFQTLRKNGVWPSLFCLSMIIFSIEVFLHSFFIIGLPLYFFSLLLTSFPDLIPPLDPFLMWVKNLEFFGHDTISWLLFNVFIVDYLFTVFIAIAYKKPQLLFYGLFFFPMHIFTSLILLSSVIPGFFTTSEGKWISPKRYKALNPNRPGESADFGVQNPASFLDRSIHE